MIRAVGRDDVAAAVLALLLATSAIVKAHGFAVSAEEVRRLGAVLRVPIGTGCSTSVVALLICGELLLAAATVTRRWRRAGLVAALALVLCGVVALGAASSWGLDPGVGCPCGLSIQVPLLHNAFATMLFRDAFLTGLAAMAWPGPPSEDPTRNSHAARARDAPNR